MIFLIIYKFTGAQRQTSSAFTHAYVHSKAYVPPLNDQPCIWPPVFLFYAGTLTSTSCSNTLLLGRAWWGLLGTCTSCTGAREILCLVSRWRQLIAAKPPRGGWGNFSPPEPPSVPNSSSERGGKNSSSVKGGCVCQHLVTTSHNEKEDKCKPFNFQCTAYKQLYPRDNKTLPPNWQLFPGDVQILFCWCTGKDLTPAITPSGQTSHKETL